MHWAAILMVEDAGADFLDHLRLVQATLDSRPDPYEVVVVANGVGPHVVRSLETFSMNKSVTTLALAYRAPLAVCLRAALKVTSADALLVCGSYQKIARQSLDDLLAGLDDRTDMVVPNRVDRVDSTAGQVQSRLFNALARWITGTSFQDLNCNVRVFRRVVAEAVELYGDMYRFLPVLAVDHGFRVTELECIHCKEFGRSGFFGFREYAGRVIDLAVLYFRSGHTRRPLRLFGASGGVFIGAGTLLLIAVGLQRALGLVSLGNSPWLLLALLLLLFGVQVAGIGLVGELMAFAHGRHKKPYVVEKTI